MASNPKKTPFIQPTAVRATVSHIQANPIARRRSLVAGQSEHASATPSVPAPAPTKLLIPGAIPAEAPAVAPGPLDGASPQWAPAQMAPTAPPETTAAPRISESPRGETSQGSDFAQFDARFTSLAEIPYYSLTQVVANHRALIPAVDDDLPVLDDEVETMDESSESRYANEEKIGEGSTSIVYLADDTRLRRKVALKRFKQISRSNDELEYLNELERISSISHPYVVSAYDADVDRKSRFIAMEYIHGLDMESAIGKKTLNFSLNRFMNFAHKALEGLEAIHQAGLLHLDIKPSNIMFDLRDSARDLVKIIDFGRANNSLDADGNPPKGLGTNGSIFYSAPEQLLSEPLDCRTDLYSLGCVFYWVLTGTRPYDGPNPVTIMSSHLRHLVTDISEIIPTLPGWLANLIMSMISLEKDDRPASACEVINVLDTDGETHKVAQFKA